eukprot:752099-Hanusia_phi.AAC.1
MRIGRPRQPSTFLLPPVLSAADASPQARLRWGSIEEVELCSMGNLQRVQEASGSLVALSSSSNALSLWIDMKDFIIIAVAARGPEEEEGEEKQCWKSARQTSESSSMGSE